MGIEFLLIIVTSANAMLSIGFFAGKTVKVLVQIDDQVLS
jgi:hypothetical protein